MLGESARETAIAFSDVYAFWDLVLWFERATFRAFGPVVALRWGGELLAQLHEHPLLSRDDNATVAALLRAYPSVSQVRQWIETDVESISVKHARAIEDAGSFLRHIARDGRCPEDLERLLTFTLRHFPLHDEAIRWTAPRRFGRVSEWLLPEDHYGH